VTQHVTFDKLGVITTDSEVDLTGGECLWCTWVIGVDNRWWVHNWSVRDDNSGSGGGDRHLAARGCGGAVQEVLWALDDVHTAVSVALDKFGVVCGVGEVDLVVWVVGTWVGYVREGVQAVVDLSSFPISWRGESHHTDHCDNC